MKSLMMAWSNSIVQLVNNLDVELDSEVLNGKVFPQIHHHASALNAGLVVMGRWGLHKEAPSLIGSNTQSFARICTTNLLVVAAPTKEIALPPLETGEPLEWTEEALKILDRIPHFARPMARAAIEKRARESGADVVEESFVHAISKKMGMQKKPSGNDEP
jgi:hypothetical protein